MEDVYKKIQKEKLVIIVQRIMIILISIMYFYIGSKGYFCYSTIGLMFLFLLSVLMGDKTGSNKIDPRVYHFLLEAGFGSLIIVLIIIFGKFNWLYLGGWLLSLFLGLIVRIIKYPRDISISE